MTRPIKPIANNTVFAVSPMWKVDVFFIKRENF